MLPPADNRTVSEGRLLAAVLCAALLWFFMFSPLTSGIASFWLEMSCSAVILTLMALFLPSGRPAVPKIDRPLLQAGLGVAMAFALWGVFFVGDRLSRLMFDFSRPQVESVYAMKTGLPAWAIAALLLAVIGPAEEFFWRGFVQKSLARLLCRKFPEADGKFPRAAALAAFVLTTLVYALVHVWSLNFMLVMAALVAGAFWGLVYMLRPGLLPALIISHALWDALVFVILPI